MLMRVNITSLNNTRIFLAPLKLLILVTMVLLPSSLVLTTTGLEKRFVSQATVKSTSLLALVGADLNPPGGGAVKYLVKSSPASLKVSFEDAIFFIGM